MMNSLKIFDLSVEDDSPLEYEVADKPQKN